MTAAPRSNYTAIEAAPPRERVERLISVTDHLMRIVEQESTFLRNKEPYRIEEVHEEKLRLTSDYAMDIGLLGKTPHILDQAPAEIVSRLKSNMKQLSEKLTENEKLLGALKDASEDLIKNVARIAARERRPAAGYGNSGQMSDLPKTAPSALSLDRQI